MRIPGGVSLLLAGGILLIDCTSSGTIGGDKTGGAVDPGDRLYQRGHNFFQQGEFDSAMHYLEQSRHLPSHELASLRDLAEIRYILAHRTPDSGASRSEELRNSLECYRTMESLGDERSETYDRLTEISFELGENETFLLFSRKYAEKFPGDRQSYNLGLAYSQVGDHQQVIATQKAAIERYGFSPYIAGFYRLLGDAYFGLGRQQSAGRTYEAGVEAAENRLAEYATEGAGPPRNAGYRQLTESRHSMLLSLLNIYRIHGEEDKIREVEQKLESGTK